MSLDDDLRDALGGVGGNDFDYDALVAGTKARASRIRRRRAAQHAVTAAVLAPVLVGTGWLVGTNLAGQGAPDQVTVAASPDDDTQATDGATGAADGTAETADGDGLVPFQDPEQLPESVPAQENPNLPNAWDIPDVRPTGVAFLDEMGAPELDLRYPRIVPLSGFMVGNDGGLVDGVEPLSAAEWDFVGDGAGMFPDSVAITVTGWSDSAAVLAALPTDSPTTHAQWLVPWTALAWEGAGPGDLLVAEQTAADEQSAADEQPDADRGHHVGAVVRQGDYLVGVSVRARTQEEAVAAATEIAERTAANLAHLDPEHAQE